MLLSAKKDFMVCARALGNGFAAGAIPKDVHALGEEAVAAYMEARAQRTDRE